MAQVVIYLTTWLLWMRTDGICGVGARKALRESLDMLMRTNVIVVLAQALASLVDIII